MGCASEGLLPMAAMVYSVDHLMVSLTHEYDRICLPEESPLAHTRTISICVIPLRMQYIYIYIHSIL